MAEEAKNEEAEGDAKSGGGKKKLILLAAGAIILVAGAVGGTIMVMGGGDSETVAAEEVEEPAKEPIYIALDPTFVVNYKDKDAKNRFLKAELNVMTFEADVEEAVTKHMPLIRGNLVTLFNQQIFEDLIHQEGKETFRSDALAALQGIMQTHLGRPGIEQIYFATFVIQ